MAPARVLMTRQSSEESSALSNIDVHPATDESGSEEAAAAAASAAATASTPPTSVSDSRSTHSSKVADEAAPLLGINSPKRPLRARSSVGTYNLKQLADAQLPTASSGSRNISALSGRTLVGQDDEDEIDVKNPNTADVTAFGDQLDKALDSDWKIPTNSPRRKIPPRAPPKPRIKDLVKNTAGNVKTVLGKRGRDMMGLGKKKLGLQKEQASPQKSKLLRELDLGKKGVLDEIDLEVDFAPPAPSRPTKRAKTSHKDPLQEIAQPALAGPLQKTSDGKRVKKWQDEGLYVGQGADKNTVQGSRKLQKKRPPTALLNAAPDSDIQKKPFKLPLPMFSYLDKDRAFTIPYDVFAPSLKKGDEKPKDWYKVNRNRLVGDAKDLWEKEERLPQSACVCQVPTNGKLGCGYDCLNRVMQYECNKDNCNLDPSVCGNRPFAELGQRTKKGGAYDIGVEVVKTENRGFGIRASRSFRPGQIIMEYTGEIISEAECQRRMREDYKDKKCYYLMELERNLVIDGTKGSMARFINHSCGPNCEVRMLKVNGIPRMAVYAGDSGIMTGEELTYDYNFDNFGESQQKCFCGADNCRGYLSKRLNAAELKKQAKIELERKRKAAEEMHKLAEQEARRKKIKTDRGSGWRGWVAIDDPETKAQLREEKRMKEEAAKNSDRARRLAARRTSLPVERTEEPVIKKRASPRRRKTVDVMEQTIRTVSIKSEDTYVDGDGDSEVEAAVTKKNIHARHTSLSSRFQEQLEPENQPQHQRPTTNPGARASLKRAALSVKSSLEIQFPRRLVPDSDEEDDEILVDAGARTSEKQESSSSRSSPRKRKRPTTAAQQNGEESDDDNEREALLAKPKRPRSLLSALSETVKSGGKALGMGSIGTGTGSGKFRQSTLNFSRKT